MVILDEEDIEVPLEEFLEIVESKQNTENPKNFQYSKNVDGYRFNDGDFS